MSQELALYRVSEPCVSISCRLRGIWGSFINRSQIVNFEKKVRPLGTSILVCVIGCETAPSIPRYVSCLLREKGYNRTEEDPVLFSVHRTEPSSYHTSNRWLGLRDCRAQGSRSRNAGTES